MKKYSDEKLQEILDTPYDGFNDCAAFSIRSYLYLLLLTLWEEGEGFSGKRPFGNSNWETDLYKCLVVNKFIDGKVYEYDDGYTDLLDYDEIEAARLINHLILHCTGSQKSWRIE